jgi:probable rRNA maturation factor
MIKPRSKVQVQIDRPHRGPIAPLVLRAAARAALTHQAAPWPRELTIRLTGDEELRRLNREFRGHDDVTDVLSFPADDVDPETGARYLGDIALSLPRAQAQAARGGHSVLAEAQLLVVHGVLHLLGHDHAKKREQARMWQAQAEILAALGAEIMGPVR